MSEDRCICCGEIVPEGRMVCPNCEKQKPMKNLSPGEMVQIAEERKDYVRVVRCKDCKWNGDDCTWCTKPSLVLNGDYISCLCIEPDWFCADGERKEKTDG